MFNVGSVQGYLKLNTTGWTLPMRSANASLGTMTKSFAKMGVVAVGSILLIEREFGKFDKAIRHATSVSETTTGQFDAMSQMALDASVRWNKAATDTAQAFYYLGSAGLTVTEQMQAFNDTVMLSRAMGSDLAMTVEGLVDVVRGFGLEFANTDRIADQLTKTVISSNQVFSDLDAALSYSAATARQTNNTLAETAAMLGVMANAGIKGSMAGTTLRRAMTNLMSPTGEMAGLIYELGLNMYDSTGRMKPFIQIMGELSDRIQSTTDEYKNMVFEVLFGRRAISGQIQLFNYGADSLRRYANEIENAGGATERVAGKQMKAFTEILGQMWRELQRVAIEVGGALAPSFERLANYMREHLVSVREYVRENGAAIASTLKWITALGAVLAIGTPLLLMVSTLTTQMIALAGVIANPFVVLIAALYTLRALWKQSTDEMKETAKTLKETLEIKAYRSVGFGTVPLMAGAGAIAGTSIGPWGTAIGGIAGGVAGFAEYWRGKRAYEQRRLGMFAAGRTPEEEEARLPDMAETVKTLLSDTMEAVKKQMAEDMADVIGSLEGVSPELGGIMDKIKAAIGEVKTLLHLFVAEPPGAFNKMADDMEKFNQKLAEARSSMVSTSGNVEAMGRRMGYLAQQWRNAVRLVFTPPAGTGKTWIEAFSTTLGNIQTAWANTIDDFIMRGGNLKDFMENMFLGILASFNRMVAEIAASDLLYKVFGQGQGRLAGTPSLMDIVRMVNPAETYYSPGLTVPKLQTAGAGRIAEVVINVDNRNAPAVLRMTGQNFDGRRLIVNAVMEEYNTNPNFRSALGR